MGDNDGTVKGKKYFDVNGGNKFGLIVRPKEVKVGDYPPTDDFNEELDEI